MKKVYLMVEVQIKNEDEVDYPMLPDLLQSIIDHSADSPSGGWVETIHMRVMSGFAE